MITTNKTGMPNYLLEWANGKNNEHRPPTFDSISTTQIIKDPTACVLLMRHSNEVEIDLQDTADQNTGSAIHKDILETAERLGGFIEQRLEEEFEVDGEKFLLTGHIDLYDPNGKFLHDIKTSKLTTFDKNKSGKDDEWKDQLTVYVKLLYDLKPYWFRGIDEIANLVNIKDLAKVKEAKAGNSTDKWRMIHYDWDEMTTRTSEVMEKIFENVRAVRKLWDTPDEELPICSEKYRYVDVKFKVYKRKSPNSSEHNKTAVSGHANYESYEDALNGFNAAGFTDKDYVIEKTGSESTKCIYFCELKDFCPHYRQMMNKEASNETSES